MRNILEKRLEAKDWSSMMLHFKQGNPLHITPDSSSVRLEEDTVVVEIYDVPLQDETGKQSSITATVTETFPLSEVRRIAYIKENVIQTAPLLVGTRGQA